ncbi:MAG: hypothetical protein OXI22_13425 [Defluviicoccus sp.]|nr:hypothetical protein [Defluviicoccus sp.]MDE0384883.1 hypothetical protein [Defluviicoccus sp.]
MPQDSTTLASPSERPRWFGFAQLALIVLAIVVALYFARAPSRVDRGTIAGPAQAKPVVSVVKPAATAHTLTLALTGTVTLQRKTRVVAEAVGRVVWVSPKFSNGGSIPANEVFVRIDPTEYELEVEAAKMAVAEAEAALGIEKPDTAEAALAQARLGGARAALALAELRLARTEISLPYASRVVSSDLEIGDLVGPAEDVGRESRLGVVYRTGALQVRVPIEQGDLAAIAPAIGRSALVRTGMGTYRASVARVSAVIAPRTRLAKLFLKFPEDAADETLPLPGTFARVQVTGPERGNVYVLPESAAREGDRLWVVRNGALDSLKPGTLGRSAAGWIVEAFDAGDGVVVGTLPAAAEGLKVDIAQASSKQ